MQRFAVVLEVICSRIIINGKKFTTYCLENAIDVRNYIRSTRCPLQILIYESVIFENTLFRLEEEDTTRRKFPRVQCNTNGLSNIY